MAKVNFWSWKNIFVGLKWMLVNFVVWLVVAIPFWMAYWLVTLGGVWSVIGMVIDMAIAVFAFNMSGYFARRWWGWN